MLTIDNINQLIEADNQFKNMIMSRQNDILAFTVDKKIDIQCRWSAWQKFAEKVNYYTGQRDPNLAVIKQIIENNIDMAFEFDEQYNYDTFISIAEEYSLASCEENENMPETEMLAAHNVRCVEDMQEIIMTLNMGEIYVERN